MENAPKKLSSKNTKEEMIKAYEDLLGKYESNASKVADKKAEIKAVAEKTIVEKASAHTIETIVKDTAALKLNIGRMLDTLAGQLGEEANNLSEIKQAITIESKNLQEIHDIKIAADTLADLIQAQEERKWTFEAEIAEAEQKAKTELAKRRAEWVKEQEDHDLSIKERDAKVKKDREREQEEYQYSLTQSRKKEKAAFEEEQAALKKALLEQKLTQEKNFAEREALISAREKEFAALKTKVEASPAELTAAVDKAEKAAKSAAENQAKVQAQLLAKETEGDKRVAELKISALEEAITKQTAQVQALTKQLGDAHVQIQNLAGKVIEGVSDAKALNKVNEIALKQAESQTLKR
ncbi:MAG: hypothetical protein HZA78_08870 [Candidatus Schekmanbacteria bacterium]|nr:hypothetical protein [Candidatus Schekmanbacteria bacterium]